RRERVDAVRVLVTGARGMLGRAVALALAARGDEVTVLQRRPSALPVREVLTDLGDPDAPLDAALAGQDAVVHLAAKVDVVGSWRDYARTNVEGTRRLLAAARAAGVARFVHVSSPSVANVGDALVGAGAGPADPGGAHGHYARSKALAEQAVLTSDDARARHAGVHEPAGHGRATRRTGTRDSPSRDAQLAEQAHASRRAEARTSPAVVVVRPHLVWGPGDAQLVGRIIARARAGRLVVVGTGTALIDTTYVDDAVDALVAALDRAPDLRGRVLVVSGGEPRPVAELLTSICAAVGAPAPRVSVPVRLARVAGAVAETFWRHEPPMTRFLAAQLSTAHWFDQRETRAALGWAPRVGLDEGCRRLRAAEPCHPAQHGRRPDPHRRDP
ncbi:MAG: NAD-dependent epimerase/dehydratase family protein, partial [Pseudonocardia sp.]|nr:NAD-dependent epimerase/dehydratase family protein [Pseudonocardia sp.]